jgi:hypothetical protein
MPSPIISRYFVNKTSLKITHFHYSVSQRGFQLLSWPEGDLKAFFAACRRGTSPFPEKIYNYYFSNGGKYIRIDTSAKPKIPNRRRK